MTKYVIEWPDTYRALPDVIDDLHRNGFNGTAMVLQQAEPLPDSGHIHRRSAEPPHSDDAPAPVLRDQLVAAVKEAGQLVSQRHIMHALSAQTEAIRAAQNVAGRAVLEFAESLADRLQPEKPEVKAETCQCDSDNNADPVRLGHYGANRRGNHHSESCPLYCNCDNVGTSGWLHRGSCGRCVASKHEDGITYSCDLPDGHAAEPWNAHRDPVRGRWLL